MTLTPLDNDPVSPNPVRTAINELQREVLALREAQTQIIESILALEEKMDLEPVTDEAAEPVAYSDESYTEVDAWNLSRKKWRNFGDGRDYMVRPDNVIVPRREYEEWLKHQKPNGLPPIPPPPAPRIDLEPEDTEFIRNLGGDNERL